MTNIEEFVLDNGLRIYFYIDKRRHSTFFQHITLFGGKNKDFKLDGDEYHLQDGIAHILEHYIVEENANGNFLKLLGERQMSTNAATGFNMTNYYFEAVEDVDFGIRTMIKGIYSPIFSEERLEKIKKPILQEIRGKMGSKFYNSNLMTFDSVFSAIKVRSIGGTLEEVSNTTLDDLKACFQAFYQPANQIIVVGGNFDKEETLKLIKNTYKELELERHEVIKIYPQETDAVVRKKAVLEFPTGEEYHEITYKIPLGKFNTKERLKLDFYLHYFLKIKFGITSKLYQELVEDKIITTSVSCSDFALGDYLLVSIGSYTSKGKELKEKIKAAINNLDDLDDEMFDICKKESILQIVLRSENLYDTLLPFIDNIVLFDYPHPDTVKDIGEFTFQGFTAMIKKLDFSNFTLMTIKNKC